MGMKLILLCRHHHSLVHEGGFAVQRTHDGRLTFTCPKGKALECVPKPRHATRLVEAFNDSNGINIDHGTVYRQRDPFIDYGMAVDGLIQCRESVRVLIGA